MKKIGLSLMVSFLVIVFSVDFSNGLPKTEEKYEIYVVKKYETLSDIAIKFGVPMEKLAKLNDRGIKSLIFAGEGIKIRVISPKEETANPQFDAEMIEKEKIEESIPNSKSTPFFLLPIILLVMIAIVAYIKYTPKSKKINKEEKEKNETEGIDLRIKFETGDKFLVNCRKDNESELIYCPICDFNNTLPIKVIKHLKDHYKKNQGIEMFVR